MWKRLLKSKGKGFFCVKIWCLWINSMSFFIPKSRPGATHLVKSLGFTNSIMRASFLFQQRKDRQIADLSITYLLNNNVFASHLPLSWSLWYESCSFLAHVQKRMADTASRWSINKTLSDDLQMYWGCFPAWGLCIIILNGYVKFALIYSQLTRSTLIWYCQEHDNHSPDTQWTTP